MAISKNFIVVDGIEVGASANVSTTLNVGANASVGGNLAITGAATFSNNVSISGNLIVTGTTTFVNTQTLNISDNIITLNSDVTGAPSENAGVEVNRGTSANTLLIWNETVDRWQITTNGSNYGNIHSTLTDVVLGTHTSGNYVASLSSGTTAVTIGGTAGEGWTPSVSIRSANTTVDGITTLVDATNNTSIVLAATANSVKTAFDLATTASSKAGTAYSNATTFASNATNISSGTLNTARLPATVNVSTLINVGANVNLSTTQITVGNATVNTTITAVNIGGVSNAQLNVVNAATINATSAIAVGAVTNTVSLSPTTITIGNSSVSATINSTAFTGSANNASNFNGQSASYYANATNITSGTLDTARLPATVNVATLINVGANVNLSTTQINVGNSSVNTTITATNIGGFSNAQLNVVNASSINTTSINATSVNTSTVNATSTVTVGTTTNSVSLSTTTITVGNSSITSSINSTSFTGTANNATNLGGQPASYYTNAANINTGTLPYAQIPANVVNTTANFTIGGAWTFNANATWGAGRHIILSSTSGVSANGTYGTAGQVLHSNGTAVYWDTDDQGVTSVATGSGLTGGTITTTGTVSVLANTGIVANATGLYVNATYIGTLTANNASNFNGQPASFYANATNLTSGTLNTARLPATVNVATLVNIGANVNLSTSQINVGNSTVNTTITATNIGGVSNAQLNVVNAATINATSTIAVGAVTNTVSISPTSISVGNSSIVATINSTAFTGTANNATNLGGQSASYYTNATNITTGTLPYAQIPANVTNTTANFTISGAWSFSSNVTMNAGRHLILSSTSGISANGTLGTNGQTLYSNGTAAYWATDTAYSNAVSYADSKAATAYSNAISTITGGEVTITRPTLKSYREFVSNTTASTSALTLDLSVSNIFDVTLANNVTLTLSNPPSAGLAYTAMLYCRQDATGGRTITWPASVKWPNSSAPTLSTGANKIDIINLFTLDGGTTYIGALSLANTG